MNKFVLTSVLSAAIGLTAGYYLFNSPTPPATNLVDKSKEETKTNTKTKKTKETRRPDGTVIREVTETIKDKKTKDQTNIDIKTTPATGKNNKLSLFVVSDFKSLDSLKSPQYGVGYERRVLGPWFLGAYTVPTAKEIGITLSLEF